MNEGDENDDLEQRYAKRLQELEERYKLKFAANKNKIAAFKNKKQLQPTKEQKKPSQPKQN